MKSRQIRWKEFIPKSLVTDLLKLPQTCRLSVAMMVSDNRTLPAKWENIIVFRSMCSPLSFSGFLCAKWFCFCKVLEPHRLCEDLIFTPFLRTSSSVITVIYLSARKSRWHTILPWKEQNGQITTKKKYLKKTSTCRWLCSLRETVRGCLVHRELKNVKSLLSLITMLV